jgi:hypothetical protein
MKRAAGSPAQKNFGNDNERYDRNNGDDSPEKLVTAAVVWFIEIVEKHLCHKIFW